MSGQPQDDRADEAQASSKALREQAERCRRLAGVLYSRESSIVLQEMAERFEQTAKDLEGKRKS